MDWWAEERKGVLLTAERSVIETARDYGIVNGLSIPTLSTAGQIAGASVISDQRDPAFNALFRERMSTLRSIVRVFHAWVYANVHYQKKFYGRLLDALSDRDKTLLQFTASGLPLKVYEDHYGISASAAGNQRSRLFKKLGVKNSSELMYLAGLLRLLEII